MNQRIQARWRGCPQGFWIYIYIYIYIREREGEMQNTWEGGILGVMPTTATTTSQQPPHPTATSKQTRTGTKYPVQGIPPHSDIYIYIYIYIYIHTYRPLTLISCGWVLYTYIRVRGYPLNGIFGPCACLLAGGYGAWRLLARRRRHRRRHRRRRRHSRRVPY